MPSEQLSVHCECTPVYDTDYAVDGAASPTEAVIEALGAVEGVAPTDLEPLYASVDSDALNRLFEHQPEASETATVLGFTVDGWNVFVRDDGAIRVCDPDESGATAPVFDRAAGD